MSLVYHIPEKVNRKRWEQLVSSDASSTLFETDEFLDAFCSWGLIVRDDFSGGIAIPVKKKMGLTIVYQPPFIQQCRWIGQQLDENEILDLLKLIKQHFHKFQLNSNLSLPSCIERNNFILNLQKGYEDVSINYQKSLAKNLRKSTNSELFISKIFQSSDSVIKLYREAYGSLNPHLTDEHYAMFSNMLKALHSKGKIVYREVSFSDEIIAVVVLPFHNKRMHYVMGAPTTLGRKMNALSVAIDSIIKENEFENAILDFEGSSITPVADFYQSFGAMNEPFYENVIYKNSFFKSVFSILGKS